MTLTSGQTEKAKEGQWNCTGCTFENKAFDVLCVMCEKPRYSDQWTCTKCSCRNPRTETECTACGPSGGNAQVGSRAVTRSAAEANEKLRRRGKGRDRQTGRARQKMKKGE